MLPDAGKAFWSPESSQPIPGEEPLDGSHQIGALGRHRRAERVRRGLHVAGHEHCPVMAHEADVQAPSRHGDPALTWMVVGVASQRVASVAHRMAVGQPTTGVY
jgi:hypothetical protein